MKELAKKRINQKIENQPRNRISWINYKSLALNVKRKSSAAQLKLQRKK